VTNVVTSSEIVPEIFVATGASSTAVMEKLRVEVISELLFTVRVKLPEPF
jgi:hypothetical protein